MTTKIFTSDSIGDGVQANLISGEMAYVRAGVFVSSNDSDAISGSGNDQTAIVYGDVVGYVGVTLGDFDTNSGQYVYVHAGASVTGFGSSAGAVAVVGTGSMIRNEGYLFGPAYGALFAGKSTTTHSTLENSGTIEGEKWGVTLGYVASSTETLIIHNTGTIRGGVASYYHQNANAPEQITNDGVMIGAVDLGRGDDLYDGRLGHVQGAILGGDGVDTLYGGVDAETISGGAGADLLDGGGNIDLLDYGISTAAVMVNLATGIATGGDAVGDDFTNFEGVIGSNYSDRLIGDGGVNTLSGGTGNDNLDGAAADDRLLGGVGKDVLTGGAGRDITTGGAGADRFVFFARTESATGANRDIITDFSHAESDRIDLSAIDANNTNSTSDAFSFIGTGAFTHHAGELHIAYSGNAATIIEADIDGNGTADLQIQLTGHITLVAGDFVL